MFLQLFFQQIPLIIMKEHVLHCKVVADLCVLMVFEQQ